MNLLDMLINVPPYRKTFQASVHTGAEKPHTGTQSIHTGVEKEYDRLNSASTKRFGTRQFTTKHNRLKSFEK